MRCEDLLKNVLSVLVLIIMIISIFAVPLNALSQVPPKWVKEGSFIEYEIEGRITSNPPIKDFGNYYVVGKARFTVTLINNTGMKGYFELITMNDTKGVFTRSLGKPGQKIPGFIKWNTAYNKSSFKVYVDPDTLPEDQKPYEEVVTKDKYVIYIYNEAQYDRETGIAIEYRFINEINNTMNYSTIKYILHYRLVNTNIDPLYKYISTTTTATTTKEQTTTTSRTHNPSGSNGEDEAYPIQTFGYIIIATVTVILGYIIFSYIRRR